MRYSTQYSILILALLLASTAAFAAPMSAPTVADRLFHEDAKLVKNTYFCGGGVNCEAIFSITVSKQATLTEDTNLFLTLEDTKGAMITPTGFDMKYDIGQYEMEPFIIAEQDCVRSNASNESNCTTTEEIGYKPIMVWGKKSLAPGTNYIKVTSPNPSRHKVDWHVKIEGLESRIDGTEYSFTFDTHKTRDGQGWATWGGNLTDWSYRLNITINSSQISNDLDDFPAYIDLSSLPSAFFTNVLENGSDIVITKSDGDTILPRELVALDTSAETGEFYFRANLSSSTDTSFFLYYGNGEGTETNDANTWNGDFIGVWHLQENESDTAPEIQDSSLNNEDGTVYNNANMITRCLAGNCYTFDGGDDYISFSSGSNVGGNNARSHCAWVNLTTTNTGGVFYGSGTTATGQHYSISFGKSTTGVQYSVYRHYDDQYSTDYGTFSDYDGNWTFACVTYDGTDTIPGLKYWVNGVEISRGASTDVTFSTSTATSPRIGTTPGGAVDFKGEIDEVLAWDTDISSSMITALFKNKRNTGMFYSISNPEEQQTGGVNESVGRNAIIAGVVASEISGSYTSYTDWQVAIMLANGTDYAGTFDIYVESGSKAWGFNYDENSTASFPAFEDLSPVFYVWQEMNRTAENITAEVTALINSTN